MIKEEYYNQVKLLLTVLPEIAKEKVFALRRTIQKIIRNILNNKETFFEIFSYTVALQANF